MKFHDTLNDKIWDIENDNQILPEVKDKLEEIANAFIEYLEIPEDAVLDIVVTGSSASYNYNKYSDLDLHIVVDYDKIHEDCPLVEGYLGALKNTFNKEHDIYIHGIPVELYAEKKDQGTVHNGLYSLNSGWVDFPEKIAPTDNDAAVDAKYQEIKEMVDKCDDSESATELLEKIYTMRKAGLAESGEFCTENLAFKKLRNEGCMDKLREIKKKDIDKQLSLESYNESIEKTFTDWFGQDLTGRTYKGDIYCSGKGLTSLKGAPKIVTGEFICSRNNLTSLEGAPQEVGGDFDCHNNYLKTLEGAPQQVSGSYDCSDNNLKSLEGAPEIVTGYFKCSKNKLKSLEGIPKTTSSIWCDHNKITSLIGLPKIINGSIECSWNKLTSLEGAPQKVGGSFWCKRNNLISLEGAPQEMGGTFDCSHNELTSLKGSPQKVGEWFICEYNNLNTLEGAPKEVGGNFHCGHNPNLISRQGEPEKLGGKLYSGKNLPATIKRVEKHQKKYRDYEPNESFPNNARICATTPTGEYHIAKRMNKWEVWWNTDWGGYQLADTCDSKEEALDNISADIYETLTNSATEEWMEFIDEKNGINRLKDYIYDNRIWKQIYPIAIKLYSEYKRNNKNESIKEDYPKNREELINKYKGVFKKNGITLEISNLYNKKEDNFSGGFGKSYNVEGKVFNKFEKALEYMKKLNNKNESINESSIIDRFKEMANKIAKDFKEEGYPKSKKFLLDFVDEEVNYFLSNNKGYKININTDNGTAVLTLVDARPVSELGDMDQPEDLSIYQARINAYGKCKVKFTDLENSNYAYESLKEDYTDIKPNTKQFDIVDRDGYSIDTLYVTPLENGHFDYWTDQFDSVSEVDTLKDIIDDVKECHDNGPGAEKVKIVGLNKRAFKAKNESIKEGFNKGDKVQLKRKNNKIGIVKSIFNGDKDKNDKDIKYLAVEFEDGTEEGRPASDFKKVNESIIEKLNKVLKETEDQDLKTIWKEQMKRDPIIDSPDGPVYLQPSEDGKSIEFGTMTNNGMIVDGSVEYDFDYSLDTNLDTVYDEIRDYYELYLVPEEDRDQIVTDEKEDRLSDLFPESKNENVATLTDKVDKANSDLKDLIKSLSNKIEEALSEPIEIGTRVGTPDGQVTGTVKEVNTVTKEVKIETDEIPGKPKEEKTFKIDQLDNIIKEALQ